MASYVSIVSMRDDASKADQLATALGRYGLSVCRSASVFEDFQGYCAVVVLLSPGAARSDLVMSTAERAFDRGKLIPVFVSLCQLSDRLSGVAMHDLSHWDGAAEDRVVQAVAYHAHRLSGQGGRPALAAPTTEEMLRPLPLPSFEVRPQIGMDHRQAAPAAPQPPAGAPRWMAYRTLGYAPPPAQGAEPRYTPRYTPPPAADAPRAEPRYAPASPRSYEPAAATPTRYNPAPLRYTPEPQRYAPRGTATPDSAFERQPAAAHRPRETAPLLRPIDDEPIELRPSEPARPQRTGARTRYSASFETAAPAERSESPFRHRRRLFTTAAAVIGSSLALMATAWIQEARTREVAAAGNTAQQAVQRISAEAATAVLSSPSLDDPSASVPRKSVNQRR
jgi:hypothetical protein